MIPAIDQNAVLERVRQRQALPTWGVFPAKQSYFLTSLCAGIILTLGLILGLVYLNQSHTILVPIGTADSPLSASDIQFYSSADNILGVVLILVALGATIEALIGFRTMEQQMLVLMPEGFVMRTTRGTKSIAYAQLQKPIKILRTRYGTRRSLVFKGAGIGKRGTLTLRLDSRFGNAKTLQQYIVNSYQAYLNMQRQAQVRQQPYNYQAQPYGL